jgi:Ca-activated chloride channel homolog
MRLCSSRSLFLVFSLIAGPSLLRAQAAPAMRAPAQEQAAASAPGHNLIQIPVAVTDGMGRPVTGLKQENFLVLEDNRPQVINRVSSGNAPWSIGIIFDLSGSMTSYLRAQRYAVEQFLRGSNSGDEYFIVGFSHHPELLSDFTESKNDVMDRIASANTGRNTALYDAILMGFDKMQQARYPRRALIVLSDGGDNVSQHSESDVRAALRRSDVQVFFIAFINHLDATVEERNGLQRLTAFSEDSGGRFLPVETLAGSGPAGAATNFDMRCEYLLTYTSDSPNAGARWRKVKVKVSPPPGMSHLTVYARAGYYAPSQ